jgi:carboxypeptidase C (cathepsin A)
MRVFVAFGYYDLATVYQGIVYNIDHIGLEPAWRANVCFAGYEGGHMMYVDDMERVRLKRDVSRFMRDAVPTS